jgi:NAD(P)-dependent dehydrogenase (short-subunit alcohol dehydrogenase family)
MGRVEGKIAIVTGAASGIGTACAATLGCRLLLAREGAKVVVTDLDDANARSLRHLACPRAEPAAHHPRP